MAKFDKAAFNWDGMYLTYGTDRKFVARFKLRGDKAGFQSFLINNFTVEEYFSAMTPTMPPAKVLESKGYVSATVKRILKEAGYPQTADGKTAYLKKQVKTTMARNAAKKEAV